ncbi:MAG: CpaD family pilus assembly protein [Alphaproteobacteria bacterium]|nr:CpaD family pilus assembly protein [Alphaproteobacteria bacterium]
MKLEDFFRASALTAMLIAGSCAAPTADPTGTMEDGAVNHPILVEPSYRDLKIGFAGPGMGMSDEDAVKFDAFLNDYRAHGNGSLGISVPAGAPARDAITFFAERAAATGISRDKILVSTRNVTNGDWRVDVSYIAYTAHTDACGGWSENLAYTADNQTPRNFGCAVQQNIAAMVADPRDLLEPRQMDASDTNRRMTVMGNYQQGKITSADKRKADLNNEQSASLSAVGSGQ